MNGKNLSYGPLLNSQGRLIETGFSFEAKRSYERALVSAPNYRIKEWDSYIISNDELCFEVSIGDYGLIGLDFVSFMDINEKKAHSAVRRSLFPLGKKLMPSSASSGNVYSRGREYELSFDIVKRNIKNQLTGVDELVEERHIYGHIYDFTSDKAPILFDLVIHQENGDNEGVYSLKDFNSKKRFNYISRRAYFDCEGTIVLGDKPYQLSRASTRAVHSFSRGAWRAGRTSWFHAALCANDGIANFWLSLSNGIGAGDEGESAVFYKGKGSRLSELELSQSADKAEGFAFPPWSIREKNGGDLSLSFAPEAGLVERFGSILFSARQDRFFGGFYGRVRLDDGRFIYMNGQRGVLEKYSFVL